MCRSLADGGQRCAAHHRKEYERAMTAVREVPRGTEEFFVARRELRDKTVEYATTREGQQKLASKIRDLHGRGANVRSILYNQMILDEGIAKAELWRSGKGEGVPSTDYGACEGQVCRKGRGPVQGSRLSLGGHALKQAKAKGFTAAQISRAFENPEKVYPNGRYPGQWRVCGEGVCLVGEIERGRFVVVTMYADGVRTPLRQDQRAQGVRILR